MPETTLPTIAALTHLDSLTGGYTHRTLHNRISDLLESEQANAVINGDMSALQRKTMPTADNSYAHDRWRLLLGAATAATVADEATDLPVGGSRHAAKLIVGAANNNKFGYFQPIEGRNMWHLRGQTVSLALKIKTTAAIGDIRAAVVQWTGTEDAVSADPINLWGSAGTNPTYTGSWANANTPSNLSPTTSWARYVIEGISISASATNLAVFIWCDDTGTSQTTDYMLITDVQLQGGSAAGNFPRIDPSLTLLQCRRYYYELDPDTIAATLGFGQCYSTTHAIAFIKPPVRMRTDPTLSVSSASDFWWMSAAGFATATGTSIVQYRFVDDFYTLDMEVVSGLVAGDATMLLAANTNARLMLSAEL